jgi:hypothetical protein
VRRIWPARSILRFRLGRMEARPVAAMKRVEGFKEDGAGVVGLGRTTVGSPRGAGGGGGATEQEEATVTS